MGCGSLWNDYKSGIETVKHINTFNYYVFGPVIFHLKENLLNVNSTTVHVAHAVASGKLYGCPRVKMLWHLLTANKKTHTSPLQHRLNVIRWM